MEVQDTLVNLQNVDSQMHMKGPDSHQTVFIDYICKLYFVNSSRRIIKCRENKHNLYVKRRWQSHYSAQQRYFCATVLNENLDFSLTFSICLIPFHDIFIVFDMDGGTLFKFLTFMSDVIFSHVNVHPCPCNTITAPLA